MSANVYFSPVGPDTPDQNTCFDSANALSFAHDAYPYSRAITPCASARVGFAEAISSGDVNLG